MLRKVILGGVVAVALASLSTAAAWDATALSCYSLMENANTVLADLGDVVGVELPSLHVGYGVRLAYGLDPAGPIPPLYFSVSGLAMSTTMRDVTASASLLGATCGIELRSGPWTLSGGLGGHRGTFDLPAARMIRLSGWGLSLEVGGGYTSALAKNLGISFQICARWLPIDEMADLGGQKYRGRGIPFVDFSGLVASIGFSWSP